MGGYLLSTYLYPVCICLCGLGRGGTAFEVLAWAVGASLDLGRNAGVTLVTPGPLADTREEQLAVTEWRAAVSCRLQAAVYPRSL